MLKIPIIILLVFLKFIDSKLVGSCNQCLANNNVACLDKDHFSICYQGSPTATNTKCPDKYVCTNDKLICRPAAEGYTPICYNDYCGECEITKGIFACIDDITYGYCFGAKTPLESTLRTCPPGFVCNYNYRAICMPENNTASCPANTTTTEVSVSLDNLTTVEATASTTTITTSTQHTITQMPTETTTINTDTETTLATSAITETSARTEPLDANTICGQIGQTGKFKTADSTCRQYVYCYLLSGQYLGWFYYCDFFFNFATQKCQRERPPHCVEY